MNSLYEFMSAALPWIAMGFLIAMFIIREESRKAAETEDFGSEGMSIGMCLGVTAASALHMNIGLGMIFGMLFGLFVGSVKEKENGK